MITYWVTVEVNFEVPLSSLAPDLGNAVGFFQTFGFTGISHNEMKEALLSTLGELTWLEARLPTFEFDISMIEKQDIQQEILLDQEIQDCISSSPYEAGLWYKSGKSFFTDDDEDKIYMVEVVRGDIQ